MFFLINLVIFSASWHLFITFVYIIKHICLHHKAEKYLLNQGSWTIVDITNLRAGEKRPKTLIYLHEIKEKAQDLI